MIRGIVGTSLNFRFMIVVIAAVLILLGIVQLSNMPVDVLPEYAPPFVEVQTEALGLATSEVESLLTVPLEELLSGIPWLQTIHSKSVPGLSSIILVFEPGTDLAHARQLVRERLGLTFFTLPNVTKAPTMLQPLSVTSRVMMIGLSSQELSPIEMSVLARWNIQPRLMGIPGVANVSIWGQRRRQLQVQVDPELLQAQGATLDQVIQSTGNALWFSPLGFLNASYPGSGGWIDTPQQRLGIRHILPISSPRDLAQVSVDGTALTLGDLGDVVEGHPPLIGDVVLNDGPGLLLVIEKFPAANTQEVTQKVDKALEALRLGLPGLEIDSQVFRAATFIETSLNNLTRTLLVGAILVVVVLFVFHWEWRVTLISFVTILLSLMAAGLMLNANGATINTMVLAGLVIALAAIVDDAIIDIENIMQRLRQHRQEKSDKSALVIILEASLEMRSTIVFAVLILVIAVLPILLVEGLTGAFFQPLILAYMLALLASMLVALIVTPALGMILLSNAPLERRKSPLVRWLQRGYKRILAWNLRTPRAAYVAIIVIMVASIAVLPILRQSLPPEFRERDLIIQWEGEPGTSHPEMTRLTTQASQELQTIPGVRHVNAHIGRAVLGDQVVGINSAEIWVSLNPEADYDATLAAIREQVDTYPGSVRAVQTYLQERVNEVLTGSSQAVGVRIYGPDLDTLRSQAEKVQQALVGIDGIVDLTIESQVYEPYVEVKVDLAKAERYGLIPGDIRRAAATLVAGLEVGILFEEQKVFDVVVWSVPQTRNSLDSLRELLIDTPDGDHVRLSDVADVRLASTLNTINREANSRRIDIGFNVSGRDLGSVTSDVENRLRQIEFPLEYHPELIGVQAEQDAALQRILVAAVAAAIGIFLLLQASFESWRLALLSFLTLPFALLGGVLAAYAGGGILSLGSLVGFLTILGIATRNGILLINRYQHLEQHEGEAFGSQLVLRGSHERIAPILTSAFTTGLALLPFVLFGNIPGHEIAYPMAVVILGGLVTSTLLNLFVVPTLYLRFGSIPEPVFELSPEPVPSR